MLADEGFGGLFRSIKEKFKNFLLDMVAQWLTSKFFQATLFQGRQPAAGPVERFWRRRHSGGIFNGIFGTSAAGPGGTAPFNGGNFAASGGGGGLNFLATGAVCLV